ncbi:MAG: GNAT family N-acetyltransferase [Myxococcota bacterium]
MKGDELDFRAMEPREADLVAFQSCFVRNGTERRLDALRWQYFENPADVLLVDFAEAEDRLASIYAVQPMNVRVDGARGLGVQSVDTLVDSDFRGRGLFTKMAEALYGRASQRGARFVYGFPNAHSAAGFFNKLGWVSLDPVPFLMRPLRTGYFTGRLSGLKWLPGLPVPVRAPRLSERLAIVELEELGPAVEALWLRFSRGIRVAVDRDAHYLAWRLRKPGERYHCLGLMQEGELAAFCAFTTVNKHGGRIGYVLELLHDPERPHDGALLLRDCLRRMARDRADVVLAWGFDHSPNAGAYRATGFFPLPERLRPIELHFGVRALDSTAEDVLADRRGWYISYCDSDTV